MQNIIKIVEYLALIFVGFSGGIAVGSGFVAFLTLLRITPQLANLSKTKQKIRQYIWALVFGTQAGTFVSMYPFILKQSTFILIPIGLLSGVFIGMLAAALTEVLNVLPIIAKRINMYERIAILVMALAFGKVAGSLMQWLFL